MQFSLTGAIVRRRMMWTRHLVWTEEDQLPERASQPQQSINILYTHRPLQEVDDGLRVVMVI